jgi:hypothetical protein
MLDGKFTSELLQATNEDNHDWRVQFCERFQHKVHENEFMSRIVWSDEAIFTPHGTMNHSNSVYWAPENPHIHVGKSQFIRIDVDCRTGI